MATEWTTADGRRLRMLRRERGLTLRSCAAKLHVTHSIVGNWETGRIPPGRNMIATLANFFVVNPSWLSTGEGSMLPEPHAPLSWPHDDIGTQWGLVPVEPPKEWTPQFQQFMTACVVFGLQPSTTNMVRIITLARELGTVDALPPELQAVVESASPSSERGWRWRGLAEHFLRSSDAALDAVEDILRSKPKDS